MMLKRLFALVALLTVLVSSIGFAASASAQTADPDAPGDSGVAALCRDFDEAGGLDVNGLLITRGECVTIVAGENFESQRYIAGVCGIDVVQASFGTTSKGQCIQVINKLIGGNAP